MRRKLFCLPLAIVILLGLCLFAACNTNGKQGFGIYLKDTGELVLSSDHINYYSWDLQEISLNSQGIEKWNSYISKNPASWTNLDGRDFAVKLSNEELYSGKFFSLLHSNSYPGVIILDAVLQLDDANNTIKINFGYPDSTFARGPDPRFNPELKNYFIRKHLIVEKDF